MTRTRMPGRTAAPNDNQPARLSFRRLLGRIGAMLRHEVSNPLQAILSEAQLLATSPAAQDPEVHAATESIERAARRIASVVAQLETLAGKKLEAEFDLESVWAPAAGLTRALAEELTSIARYMERPLEPPDLPLLAPRLKRAARLAHLWLSASEARHLGHTPGGEATGPLAAGARQSPAAAIALADRLERTKAAYRELTARFDRRERYWRFALHELRNSAHSFLSWAASLRRTEVRNAPWFAPLRRSAETLLRRAEEALDPAAPDRGTFTVSPAPVDVLAAAREALEMVRPIADLRGLKLAFSTPQSGEPVDAMADLDRLQQILHNLLRNAVQATPPGGSICVSAYNADSFAMLEVEDSGPGVPAHVAGAIFQLDASQEVESPRGFGLGLPLSRSLAEQMGGSLTLEPPASGSGARFLLKLPRSKS